MKIKKGKLNYDQSGRAYPDNPRLKENWDSIWEYEGKYYKLVGDNEHKEWDEVNIYNQIIDEAYENYRLKSNDIDLPENLYNNLIDDLNKDAMFPIDNPSRMLSKESFIHKCKTDSEFSEMWGLLIKETYDLIPHTEDFGDVIITKPKRKNKLIVVYKNEIIEIYD